MKKFLIDHIDPLGQGVFKEEDQIYFIPKTLPEETGLFSVLKQSKGVNFCKLESLEKASPWRMPPSCPHFDKCSGCHFLHTDYSHELDFKKQSFTKLISKLDENNQTVEIINSPKRLGYRNRIQLHFDVRKNSFGLKKSKSNQILSVPHCQIMLPEIKAAFDKLSQNWRQEARQRKLKSGHVEIYLQQDKLNISWNKNYAQGGFTQVNNEVNLLIKEKVKSLFTREPKNILDLFGGAGNLSEIFDQSKKMSVDFYSDEKRNQRFFHLDLYSANALETFQNEHTDGQYDLFIVDPPRSGFKNLLEWIQVYRPEHLLYVSCHSATMIRDLKPLMDNYQITKTIMADLFPGTYHFEGIILLQKLLP